MSMNPTMPETERPPQSLAEVLAIFGIDFPDVVIEIIEIPEPMPQFYILNGHVIYGVPTPRPVHDILGHAQGGNGWCDCGV